MPYIYLFKSKNHPWTKVGKTLYHPIERIRAVAPHGKGHRLKMRGFFYMGDIEHLSYVWIDDDDLAIRVEDFLCSRYVKFKGIEYLKMEDNDRKEIRDYLNQYGEVHELSLKKEFVAKAEVPEYL